MVISKLCPKCHGKVFENDKHCLSCGLELEWVNELIPVPKDIKWPYLVVIKPEVKYGYGSK